MDIAKYIGLFLLKNHFCYVHGLGNMELRKIPAAYDSKTLKAPSYEVVVTPGGSIDDNLANFIAVNEQISISKAANALRDFSIQARKEMASGKEVGIPNIGKFIEQNSKITFITDPNFQFTPSGIPTIRNSKQLEEQNARPVQTPQYPTPHKADSVNWSMIILIIVLMAIIGGCAFGIYYYMTHTNRVSPNPRMAHPVDTVKPAPPPAPATAAPIIDTTHPAAKDTAAMAQPAADSLLRKSFKIIIGDYPSRDRAEKRMKNLTIIGNKVDLFQKDSSNYMVYTTIECKPEDTSHVKDSLRRLFGYHDVMIIK